VQIAERLIEDGVVAVEDTDIARAPPGSGPGSVPLQGLGALPLLRAEDAKFSSC